MKRLVFGVLDILVILSILAIGATAAPVAAETVTDVGPYEGSFHGVAYGDQGSRARLTLELTHRGDQVQGRVSIGSGLLVDGGYCGAYDIPATAARVGGQTDSRDPRYLEVAPTFDVGSFDLQVDFESTLSSSGNVINAKAKVDLPWFCGRDPVLRATLYRK